MVNFFKVYKTYPFTIPLRVKFFNIFRSLFTIPALEGLLISKLSNSRKGWERLIPPLYFYPHGTVRKAERAGLWYELDVSRLIDHSIFFYKLNEPTWDVLFRYIKEDSYVIDVGANIGFLSMQFASRCSKGKVFSFEPDAQNFENLKRNIELNNFDNVSIYKNALGATAETVTLYKIFENNPGANRILFTKPDVPHQQERIDVLVLDKIAGDFNIPRVDVMKIDVEGFEIFVLQGATQMISKWRPVLFVELAEVNLRQHGFTAVALVEFIEQLWYDVRDARTMQAVDKFKTDYHTDIICFPQSKTVHE